MNRIIIIAIIIFTYCAPSAFARGDLRVMRADAARVIEAIWDKIFDWNEQ